MNKRNAGFTIVELLIVIVVIAILAAISIVAFTGIQDRANNTTVKSDLSNVMKKMRLYKVDNGSFPLTSAELPDVDVTVSKGAYLVQPNTVYNVVPCVSSDGKDMSIAAMSKSGKRYYISSRTGSVEEVTTASDWTISNGYATMCSESLAGSSLPSGGGAPGYGNGWRSWLD